MKNKVYLICFFCIIFLLSCAGSSVETKNLDSLIPVVKQNNLSEARDLIYSGQNVLETDSSGNTALHYSVENDNIEITKLIIDSGADTNYMNNEGVTSVHIAATTGNIEIMQLLIDAGADLNLRDANGNTVLFYALKSNNDKMLLYILDKIENINQKDFLGNTLLHNAVKNSNVDLVNLLIEKGIDVNIKNSEGKTALDFLNISTAVRDKQRDTIIFYTALGGELDIYAKDDKKTLLEIAILSGDINFIEFLLDEGINPNYRDATPNTETPLHFAIRNKKFKVAELLIDYGASVYLTTKNGETVLHYVCGLLDQEKSEMIKYENLAEVLIKNGADINYQDKLGNTALHYAVDNNLQNTVILLIDNFALNNKNKQGISPLTLAEKSGDSDTINLIKNIRDEKLGSFEVNNIPYESLYPEMKAKLDEAFSKWETVKNLYSGMLDNKNPNDPIEMYKDELRNSIYEKAKTQLFWGMPVQAYQTLNDGIVYLEKYDVEPYGFKKLMREASYRIAKNKLKEEQLAQIENQKTEVANIDYKIRRGALKKELIVQKGHREGFMSMITDIEVDPSGEFFVTATKEGIIKIWNIKSGLLIKEIDEGGAVYELAIDRSGKYLAWAAREKYIKIFSFYEMKVINKIDKYSKEILFDSKGENLLIANNQEISLIDPKTGRVNEVKKFNKAITKMIFDKKSENLITANFMELTVYSYPGFRELRSKKVFEKDYIHESIGSIAVSNDGRYIAATEGSGWYEEVECELKILDFETLNTVHNLKTDFDINDIEFDPTSSVIAAGTQNKMIHMWSVKTGEYIKGVRLISGLVSALAFSPLEKYLLVGDTLCNIYIKNIKGETLHTFKEDMTSIFNIALSPDNSKMIYSDKHDRLYIWDFQRGGVVKVLDDNYKSYEAKGVAKLKVSSNNKDLIYAYRDNQIEVVGIESGLTKRKFYHNHNVLTFDIDDNQKYLISSEGDNFSFNKQDQSHQKVLIWDYITGKKLKTIGGFNNGVVNLKYSAKHNLLITGEGYRSYTVKGEDIKSFNIYGDPIILKGLDEFVYLGGTVKIIDFDTGRVIKSIENDIGQVQVRGLVISPDEKYFAYGLHSEIYVYSLETLQLIKKIKNNISSEVENLLFTPDGKNIVSYDQSSNIYFNDINSFKITKKIERIARPISAMEISKDGKYMLVCARDKKNIIYDLSTDKYITIYTQGSEWMMHNNEGYFDASRNGGKLVGISEGLKVFGIDQIAAKYNRPELVLKTVGLGSKTDYDHFYSQYKKRLRKLKISEEDLNTELKLPQAKVSYIKSTENKAKVKFILTDDRYNLKSYNIYVNDVALFGSYGKEISGKRVKKEELITLTKGRNKIEISAINEKGQESYKTLNYIDIYKEEKGDLYFIGFGVSSYKDSSLDLKYAHKDALDLAKMFSLAKYNYNNVYTKTFINDQVTKENIKTAKEFLKNSKAKDTFVLFIAGHGIHDTDSESTYYYITYGTDIDNLKETAADFEMIEEILQGIAPRNKLFLLDTCESGEADSEIDIAFSEKANIEKLRARSSRAIKRLKKQENKKEKIKFKVINKDRFIYNDLRRRSGAIVLSSSKAYELSYEKDEYKNGLFSESLIKGLTTYGQDTNSDRLISVYELLDYLEKSVPKLTGNLQHPTIDRDNIYLDFGFPSISGYRGE